ncbi:MAG TPA: Thivi_2564 family membrane protein [Bacteroidales bacterium]|nr:Thivi_2564 family membrane protein [Bacteroidales bacterium]
MILWLEVQEMRVLCVNDVTYFNQDVMVPAFRPITFEVTLKIFIMPLLTILIVLIVAGILLWLVNTYIPMDRTIKSIFNVVVVILVIIWVLKAFGLFHYLKDIHI